MGVQEETAQFHSSIITSHPFFLYFASYTLLALERLFKKVLE